MRLAFTVEANRPLLFLAVALAMAAVPVFHTKAHAQTRVRIPAGNPILSRYVPLHFKPEVLSGRITATSSCRNFPHINSAGETLTIQTDGSTGKIELKYEGPFREGPSREEISADSKSREGRVSIMLDTAGLLEIELTIGDASKPNDENSDDRRDRDVVMRFLQQPGRSLTLSLGSSPEQRDIHAATIWELLIAHRDECREFLLPILYRMRPGWDLMVTADLIQEQLLQMAAEGKPPQYARWQKLVEQLGDDSYSKREAADRRLRAAGRRVLAFLNKLDGQALDAEQRFRISRIVRSFQGQEQSPREIAEEMSDDPSIWLAVAADERESVRRTSLSELRRLLEQPIDFDPAAEAAIRQNQLRKINQQITGD